MTSRMNAETFREAETLSGTARVHNELKILSYAEALSVNAVIPV